MRTHRSHNSEFKSEVVEEYLGGETLHSLAKRHDISRNLIHVWLEKYGPEPTTMPARLI